MFSFLLLYLCEVLQEEILLSEKPSISTKKKTINIGNKRIQHDQQQIFKSNKTNILPSDDED